MVSKLNISLDCLILKPTQWVLSTVKPPAVVSGHLYGGFKDTHTIVAKVFPDTNHLAASNNALIQL